MRKRSLARCGAVIGEILYSVATAHMQDLTQQDSGKTIPKWTGGPITEPVFVLGLLFIFVVMFAPR